MRTSEDNRRYYLHVNVKRVGFRVISRDRVVLVPFTYNGSNRYISELNNKFHYSIQTFIK